MYICMYTYIHRDIYIYIFINRYVYVRGFAYVPKVKEDRVSRNYDGELGSIGCFRVNALEGCGLSALAL